MLDLADKRVLVISDTHYRHHNIIKYCGRPVYFERPMLDAFITARKDADLAIHVGDFGLFRKPMEARKIYDEMFGALETILIIGNHDKGKRNKAIRQLPWGQKIEKQPFVFKYQQLTFAIRHEPFNEPILKRLSFREVLFEKSQEFLRKVLLEKNARHTILVNGSANIPDKTDVIMHGHIHQRGQRYKWLNTKWGGTLAVNACVEHWSYQPFFLSNIVQEYWDRKQYENKTL